MILPGNPPGRPPPPPFRTWDTKHSISLFFLPHPAVLMLLNRRLIETLATQAMSNAAEDIVKINFAPALIPGTVSPRTYKCLSVYEFTLHRTISLPSEMDVSTLHWLYTDQSVWKPNWSAYCEWSLHLFTCQNNGFKMKTVDCTLPQTWAKSIRPPLDTELKNE